MFFSNLGISVGYEGDLEPNVFYFEKYNTEFDYIWLDKNLRAVGLYAKESSKEQKLELERVVYRLTQEGMSLDDAIRFAIL